MSKEIKEEVKMYITNDWDIEEETPEFVLLTRNKATGIGHLVVFLIFGWWTFFIGNVIYHFTSKQKKKIIK